MVNHIPCGLALEQCPADENPAPGALSHQILSPSPFPTSVQISQIPAGEADGSVLFQ